MPKGSSLCNGHVCRVELCAWKMDSWKFGCGGVEVSICLLMWALGCVR